MEAEPADLVELPADRRAAGLARTAVRDRLRAWGLEDVLDTAVLLTSEVVTNVILHTASAPVLDVTRHDGGLLVRVYDGSTEPPRHQVHSATATTGRGVELLDELADGWGWEPVGDGKAVWFRLGGGADPGHDEPAPAAARDVSPMGRYASAAAEDAPLVAVHLLGVPVRVLVAVREHHDGLMREFRLLALAGPAGAADVPARLVELTQELGLRYAVSRARPDAEVDRALKDGRDTVDLSYRVPPSVVDAARRLHALSAEADEFCRTAQLITTARTPVMVRLANWYTDEIVNQVAGRPAVAWDGPLDLA